MSDYYYDYYVLLGLDIMSIIIISMCLIIISIIHIISMICRINNMSNNK